MEPWPGGRKQVHGVLNLLLFFVYAFVFWASLKMLLLRAHKVFDEMKALGHKLATVLDHESMWLLKDPSNLAVTRILFGKL